MYAVVDIAGQQFRIEKDNKLLINRIKGEVGEKVNFSKVLFIDNNGKVKVGSPYIKDASVTVKILSHVKGDKIKVFKKKRRKGYEVLNGFRHFLTEVLIEDISETKSAQKVTSGKETAKVADEKEEVKKVEAEPVKDTAKQKAVPKTTAEATTGKAATAKKPAATKAAAEKAKTAVKKPAAKATGSKTASKKGTTAKSTDKTTRSKNTASK